MFMEIDGDKIPLSVIPLSYSLPYKCTNMDLHILVHGHTSFHTLSYMKIHPQLYSILLTTAGESFSRFHLSGQRFTAERAASPAMVRGGLLFRGIICSHLIFISYWEICGDKLF